MAWCRRRHSMRRHPRSFSTGSQLQLLATREPRGHVLVAAADARAKSLAAAARVRWLVDQDGDRHVLALAAAGNERSRLHRLVDTHVAFNELERRGHGVSGVTQWCQQALEESGYDKRVFPRGRLAAFLAHHRAELPLDRLQRSLTSPLATRRALLDLLQLFQLLEAEGISPAAYSANAAATEDPKQLALAQVYDSYRQLLETHHVTSWDGVVLDALELSSGNATVAGAPMRTHSDFADAVLHGYTDLVVDDLHAMTPAMVKLLANLCAHPSIRSSTSFSRVLQDGAECPRISLLRRELEEAHGITADSLALEDTELSVAATEIRASAHQILDPASARTQQKGDERSRNSTAAVSCCTYDTTTAEELGIARLVKERLDGLPTQTIAVLAPTYPDAQRLAAALTNQGIAVQDHAASMAASTHLFDEPGVNTVFSLLVALCYPADSRHLYNVLRSSFVDISPLLLSRLMAKEIKAHVDLFRVLEEFVTSGGESLRAVASSGEEVAESELQVAAKFVELIKRLRSECHEKSTQELVQTFLEETGRLESLLDPATPSEDQEAIALADFLREIEAAQSVVQSAYVPFVVPYLQQLRESQVNATYQRGASVGGDGATTSSGGVVVLPLTPYNIQNLDVAVLFLASMRDSKFPGRLKRLTLPLPYKLLSLPFPVQSRAAFIEQSEKLVFEAMRCAEKEVLLSYAVVASASSGGGNTAKGKEESVSRVLLPIWNESSLRGSSEVMADARDTRSSSIELSSPSARLTTKHLTFEYEPSHLSYSQISEYLRCPQRYFLARVMKLPSEVSSAMMYGRALHEAIASFAVSTEPALDGAADSHDDPRNSAGSFQVARDRAHRVLEQAWESEGMFASPEQEQHLREQGHKALDVFCEQHADRRVLYVERDFEVFVPEAAISLRGVWDRIDLTDEGPVIREFKTNMSGGERNVAKLAKDSLQLKLYLYAFHAVFGYAPRGAVLEMIGDESGSSAASAQEQEGYVPYTLEAASEALDAIQSVATGLRKGDFAPRPGYMECAFCPYAASACRAGGDEVVGR